MRFTEYMRMRAYASAATVTMRRSGGDFSYMSLYRRRLSALFATCLRFVAKHMPPDFARQHVSYAHAAYAPTRFGLSRVPPVILTDGRQDIFSRDAERVVLFRSLMSRRARFAEDFP